MKETMTIRFFNPIWKCEEMEQKLQTLESEGWRLDKISGFRKFHFVKSKPKAVKYFFTSSFIKDRTMLTTEMSLVRDRKATKIKGDFFEFLKSTSVYRITRPEDLAKDKFFRNISLQHLIWQYIWLGLLFTALSVTGITLSYTINKNPLFDIKHLTLAVIGILGVITAGVNLPGLLYLRKQYERFFHNKKFSDMKE